MGEGGALLCMSRARCAGRRLRAARRRARRRCGRAGGGARRRADSGRSTSPRSSGRPPGARTRCAQGRRGRRGTGAAAAAGRAAEPEHRNAEQLDEPDGIGPTTRSRSSPTARPRRLRSVEELDQVPDRRDAPRLAAREGPRVRACGGGCGHLLRHPLYLCRCSRSSAGLMLVRAPGVGPSRRRRAVRRAGRWQAARGSRARCGGAVAGGADRAAAPASRSPARGVGAGAPAPGEARLRVVDSGGWRRSQGSRSRGRWRCSSRARLVGVPAVGAASDSRRGPLSGEGAATRSRASARRRRARGRGDPRGRGARGRPRAPTTPTSARAAPTPRSREAPCSAPVERRGGIVGRAPRGPPPRPARAGARPAGGRGAGARDGARPGRAPRRTPCATISRSLPSRNCSRSAART